MDKGTTILLLLVAVPILWGLFKSSSAMAKLDEEASKIKGDSESDNSVPDNRATAPSKTKGNADRELSPSWINPNLKMEAFAQLLGEGRFSMEGIANELTEKKHGASCSISEIGAILISLCEGMSSTSDPDIEIARELGVEEQSIKLRNMVMNIGAIRVAANNLFNTEYENKKDEALKLAASPYEHIDPKLAKFISVLAALFEHNYNEFLEDRPTDFLNVFLLNPFREQDNIPPTNKLMYEMVFSKKSAMLVNAYLYLFFLMAKRGILLVPIDA